MRLFKKGKSLVDKEDSKKVFKTEETDKISCPEDKKLLALGTSFLKFKLDHNVQEMENKGNELADYFASELVDAKKKYKGNANLARQHLMKKIRCILVKHPYDYLGRKMAVEAREKF